MDDFLEGLVADLRPVRPRRPHLEALALVALCLVELALWLAMDQARPNLAHVAQTTPTFWWKLTSFGLIAGMGAATAISSFDPSASPRRGLTWIAGAVVAYLIVGAVMDGHAARPGILERLDWYAGVNCLERVVLLSTPAMALLGILMRKGAPTHRAGTALAAGIAAAAWAAFVFTFACDHDDPLYVAVWYTLACTLSASIARLLLPILTRW